MALKDCGSGASSSLGAETKEGALVLYALNLRSARATSSRASASISRAHAWVPPLSESAAEMPQSGQRGSHSSLAKNRSGFEPHAMPAVAATVSLHEAA